jgi:Na+/proline symporter
MKKLKLAVWVLSILLLVSNVWWAFLIFDAGITQTYMGHSLKDHKEALQQIIRIYPLAISGSSKSAILNAARSTGDSSEIFEQDGVTYIGKIGVKFDEKGRPVEVMKAWE